MGNESLDPRRLIELALGQAIALAEDGFQVLLLIRDWDDCDAQRSFVSAAKAQAGSEEKN